MSGEAWTGLMNRLNALYRQAEQSTGRARQFFDAARASVEQAGTPQVQHHLGHTAGEKHLHGGEVPGAIGESIHQSGYGAIHSGPVVYRWAAQARGVRDGRDVKKQVGRSSERRVQHHRIVDRGIGQHIFRAKL